MILWYINIACNITQYIVYYIIYYIIAEFKSGKGYYYQMSGVSAFYFM